MLSRKTPFKTAPSLTAAVYGFVLVSALTASTIMLFGIRDHARDYEHAAQSAALDMRTRALVRGLSETLEREWSTLTGLARDLPAVGMDEMHRLLHRTAQPHGIVHWAGFAGADGHIAVASDLTSAGSDVSDLPWFRRGLLDDYASGSAQSLDLATPVARPDGGAMGVLTFQIDPDWPRRTIDERARELGLDVFLLSSDGDIGLRGGIGIDAPLDPQAARLIAPDAARALLSRDAGGAPLLTTVTEVALMNMPSLGWRIVSRIHTQAPGAARADLMQGMVTLLAALFAEVMLATYAFLRIFIRPLQKLAHNAQDIAAGKDVYPVEASTSREAQELSWALARLQTNAIPVPGAVAEMGAQVAAGAGSAGAHYRHTAPRRPVLHPDAMPASKTAQDDPSRHGARRAVN